MRLLSGDMNGSSSDRIDDSIGVSSRSYCVLLLQILSMVEISDGDDA